MQELLTAAKLPPKFIEQAISLASQFPEVYHLLQMWSEAWTDKQKIRLIRDLELLLWELKYLRPIVFAEKN